MADYPGAANTVLRYTVVVEGQPHPQTVIVKSANRLPELMAREGAYLVANTDLAGFSRTTLSRGEVIVDDYRVVGREGRGQWLPRATAGLMGARETPPPPREPREAKQPSRESALRLV